ncbi:GxxExxY protein [Patescibacteria group bacterium]|nr:GxxExxY protein [Patescibacteria group bacterium]
MKEDFLYEKETYNIRGACFDVWGELGGAFKEKIVENALVVELESRGFRVERQRRFEIHYKGKKVGVYIPDIIVNDKILIELKVKEFITKGDQKQFWYYLKATNYKLGLLINFSPDKLEIMRRIYDTARKSA